MPDIERYRKIDNHIVKDNVLTDTHNTCTWLNRKYLIKLKYILMILSLLSTIILTHCIHQANVPKLKARTVKGGRKRKVSESEICNHVI